MHEDELGFETWQEEESIFEMMNILDKEEAEEMKENFKNIKLEKKQYGNTL